MTLVCPGSTHAALAEVMVIVPPGSKTVEGTVTPFHGLTEQFMEEFKELIPRASTTAPVDG
jgi:hypothetical protein